MKNSILRLVALSTPLLLGACGEGWEAQRTDQVAPYGNYRTAGTGVAYVRAKMLPKKELKIEQEVEEVTPVPAQPILDAEEIFTEQQIKGSPPTTPEIVPENDDTVIEEGEAVMELEPEDHSSNIDDTLMDEMDDVEITELSAEEYIAQEPKKAEMMELDISEIEPLAGTETDFDMVEFGEDTIEVYESEVSQPMKQIIVPKQDFIDLRTEGEVSLDEIYNDKFISSF